MLDFSLSLLASALPALLLWAFLPRGVTLTRSRRKVDWQGNPVHDTWEVRNSSALPITILSVTVSSPEIRDLELDADSDEDNPGAALMLDEDDGLRGELHGGGWRGVTVLPGDTLNARVITNARLKINYRRSGKTGILERRELILDGGA